MKKYPKIVQCDQRGQLVIPKDIRLALGIEAGTGFWVYSIGDEGILLKKVERDELESDSELIKDISSKSDKIGISKAKLEKSVKDYKKTKVGNLEVIE